MNTIDIDILTPDNSQAIVSATIVFSPEEIKEMEYLAIIISEF